MPAVLAHREFFSTHILTDGEWNEDPLGSTAHVHITDVREGNHLTLLSFAIVDSEIKRVPVVFAAERGLQSRGSFSFAKGDLFFLEFTACTITFQISDVEDWGDKHRKLGSVAPYPGIKNFGMTKSHFARNTPAKELGSPAQASSRTYEALMLRTQYTLLQSHMRQNLLPLNPRMVWARKLRLSTCDLMEICASDMRNGERIPQMIGSTGFSSSSLRSLGRYNECVVTPVTFLAILGMFVLSTTAPADEAPISPVGHDPCKVVSQAVQQILVHHRDIHQLLSTAVHRLTENAGRTEFLISALKCPSTQELARGLLHHISKATPMIQFCAAPGTGKTFAGQALCLLILAAGDVLSSKGLLGTQYSVKEVSHTNTAVLAMASNMEKLAGPDISPVVVHLLASSAQHDFPSSQRTSFTKVAGDPETTAFSRHSGEGVKMLLLTLGLAARQHAYYRHIFRHIALLLIDEATKNNGLDSQLALQGCPPNTLIIPVGDTNQLEPHVSEFGRDTNKLYRDHAPKHFDSQVLLPEAVPLPEHSSLAAIGETNLRGAFPSRERIELHPRLAKVATFLNKPSPTYHLNQYHLALVKSTLGDPLASSAFCACLTGDASDRLVLQLDDIRIQLPKPTWHGAAHLSFPVVISANTRTALPLLRMINAGVASHLYMQAGPEHIRPTAQQVTVLAIDVANHDESWSEPRYRYGDVSWEQYTATEYILERMKEEEADRISASLTTEKGPILVSTRWTRQVLFSVDRFSEGSRTFFNDKVCRACKDADLSFADFAAIVQRPHDHEKFFEKAGFTTTPTLSNKRKALAPFLKFTTTFDSQGSTTHTSILQFLCGDTKRNVSPTYRSSAAALKICANAMVDLTRARKQLLLIAAISTLIAAKLPGYSPFAFLCERLGLVAQTNREGTPYSISFDNVSDELFTQRLDKIVQSKEFRELKYESCMYGVALCKMLYIEDFHKYIHDDDMADTVIAELPEFYPFLLSNPDLHAPEGHPGSSGFQRRANKLLKNLRHQKLLKPYASILDLDKSDVIDGVLRIPFKGKGPDMVCTPDEPPTLLYHGTTWQGMLGICNTGHIVRGGLHSRPAEGKHGVFAASEAEQALGYAAPTIAADMAVQVLFLLRCFKTCRLRQLSGAQYVLREHWFSITHLAIRPCSHEKVRVLDMPQQVVREPVPDNWRQYDLNSWLPLSELRAPIEPCEDVIMTAAQVDPVAPPPSPFGPVDSPSEVEPTAEAETDDPDQTLDMRESHSEPITGATLGTNQPADDAGQGQGLDQGRNSADYQNDTDDDSSTPSTLSAPPTQRRQPQYFQLDLGRAPAQRKFAKQDAPRLSAWRTPLPVHSTSAQSTGISTPLSCPSASYNSVDDKPSDVPLSFGPKITQWCHHTLTALRATDLKVWWLRDAGSADASQHSIALFALLNSDAFVNKFFTLATRSFFQNFWHGGLPRHFTSALLFHSSKSTCFILSEVSAQLLFLAIGGDGEVFVSGNRISLQNGVASPSAISWQGARARRANDAFCCEIRIEVQEANTDVLVFFWNPQSTNKQNRQRSLKSDDLLYDAARYSLSPFAKDALIQQWLVVDALLEHNVLPGLPSENRTTMPHLFSRVEFRPSPLFAAYESQLGEESKVQLLINESVGATLAYYFRRTPINRKEAFLHELRALLAAETNTVFRHQFSLSDVLPLWEMADFWTTIVQGLSINNTPLGSPILGSFSSKKLSLREPGRHSPSELTATKPTGGVKDFLTVDVPHLINSGESICPSKGVRQFRKATFHAPHSVRVVVPAFIADEIAQVALQQQLQGSAASIDGWRPPKVTEMEFGGGDQREHAYAKPLRSYRLEVHAFSTEAEEARRKDLTLDEQAAKSPFMLQVDIELGLLRTGSALNNPYLEIVPGTLETSDAQMSSLRRLQLMRAISLAPTILDFLVAHGHDDEFTSKAQLHLALENSARRLHTEVRSPIHRGDTSQTHTAQTCTDLFNSVTIHLRKLSIEQVSPTSMRLAILELLTGRRNPRAEPEFPSVIQSLNLQAFEMLKFEALHSVDYSCGLMGTCAYVLTFQFRAWTFKIRVSDTVSASPTLCYADRGGREYRVDRFNDISERTLSDAVQIACTPAHVLQATQQVLRHQLRGHTDFAANYTHISAAICLGLNLGGEPLALADGAQITYASLLPDIMDTLLTADVKVYIQDSDQGYSLSSIATTSPIRVVATTQGILFPQPTGRHLSLTSASSGDPNYGDRVGIAQVELQSSGEVIIFHELEDDTKFLTPRVTLQMANEVQRSLLPDIRPPFITHVIMHGSIGTDVKRVLPLHLQQCVGAPIAIHWFWLRLEDALGADRLFGTTHHLATVAPGNSYSGLTLHFATLLVMLLYKAENIRAYVAHTVLLVHLVASQLAAVFDPSGSQETNTFSLQDIKDLQQLYSFAFSSYSQLMSVSPRRSLLHLRLWFTALTTISRAAYNREWELQLQKSLRKVEEIDFGSQPGPQGAELVRALSVVVLWNYSFFNSKLLRHLKHFFNGYDADQKTCEVLFGLGLPPLWCLALARAVRILESDVPSTPQIWWREHKDLLMAMSDSYSMEIFLHTESMVAKSTTMRLLSQLEGKERKIISCREFLGLLRKTLQDDLQISASFSRGDSAVPHNWTPSGLNALRTWTLGKLDKPYQVEYCRLPFSDWQHLLTCLVYAYNVATVKGKIYDTSNDGAGFMHNWHKIAQTIAFLPHVSTYVLGQGKPASWIFNNLVQISPMRQIGNYSELLRKISSDVFDKDHLVGPPYTGNFVDAVLFQSVSILLYDS